MPVLLVSTNADLDGATLSSLARRAGQALTLDEARVLVKYSKCEMFLANGSEGAALIELRCAKPFSEDESRSFVEAVTFELAALGVAPSRVFVQLLTLPGPSLWRTVDGGARHAAEPRREGSNAGSRTFPHADLSEPPP